MIELIFWFGMFTFYFIFFFYWVYALFKGAPFYPSNKAYLKTVVELVKQEKNARVVDLGAGDGRIVIALAKEGIYATGIEINPFLTLIAKLIIKIRKIKTAKIINNNIFKENLSGFNVVVVYLFPEIMRRLEAKIFQELPSGSLVISNTFAFKKHQPYKVINKKILLYRTP